MSWAEGIRRGIFISDCALRPDEKRNDDNEEHEIEVIRDSNFLEHDLIQFEKEEDSVSSIHDVHFFIDYSGNQLFPFELVDSKTEENLKKSEDEDHEFGDFQKADVKSEEIDESVHQKTEELHEYAEKSHVYHENLIDFTNEQLAIDEQLQGSDSDLQSGNFYPSISIKFIRISIEFNV